LNIQGKYAEALSVYRQVVTIFPEDSYVHMWLGNQLSNLEQYAEANLCYRKALELAPRNGSARIRFGMSLQQQGKYAEAITQYQQATAIDPTNWAMDISVQLGNIAYKQGNTDEARQSYRKAYELSENDFTRYREHIKLKMRLAERSLLGENAEQAFAFADDVIQRQLFSAADRLAMRFIVVTSLLYQQKRTEALTALQAFIDYYDSLAEYNEKWWDYETLHNVIEMSEELTDTDKTLLLNMMDLLELPKTEGDDKLTEFEAEWLELLTP
jgi:Tfp pilus assembly protein PilF